MFRAVREWWRSGRGQQTARLFVFELTVVMIGVLAAQQISNWAQRHYAVSQVEGLHDDLFHNFEIYRRIALTHRAAVACLDQQVDLILDEAATSQPFSPSLLKSVDLMSMGPDPMPPDSEQSLRDRYGDSVAGKIGSMEFNLRINEDNNNAIDKEWYQFERVDPRHGPISAADRAAVRESAARIKGYLANLRASADLIVVLTGMLGVHVDRTKGPQPISCETMRRTGRAFVGD